MRAYLLAAQKIWVELAILLLACATFFNWGYTMYVALGLLFCCLVVSSWVKKAYGWLPAIAFFYFTASGISRIAAPLFFWPGVPIEMVSTLESIVSQSTLYVVLITLCFSRRSDYMGAVFVLLGFLNSVAILVEFARGRPPCFLFNNPAMDAGFVAVTFPPLLNFAWQKLHRKFLLIVPITALFVTDSSTGVMGACLAVGAYLCAKYKFHWKAIAHAVAWGSLFSGVGFLLQKDVLLNSDGRTAIWKQTFAFWMNKGLNFQELTAKGPAYLCAVMFNDLYHYIGTGLGTFFLWGPSLQLTEAVKLDPNAVKDHFNAFFWLHNDWLQVLIETGWLGLAITASVVIVALVKAKRSPAVFASLATYAAIAVIQMPLRHFLFAAFGMFLLSKAFNPAKK